MLGQVLISFLPYAQVTGFTPGPNNILALDTVSRNGRRKGRPMLLGIAGGFLCVMVLCAVVCFELVRLLPVCAVLGWCVVTLLFKEGFCMERYLKMLTEGGADLAVEIKPEMVVTAPWTIYKCKFGCSTYGKSYCCPPNTPSYQETRAILDCYQRGILFRTHSPLTITPLAAELARELFLDGYYKAIAFGDGDCQRCKTCSTDHCNFPGKTVPSMEACGIDVFATVRSQGLGIHTLRERGEEQNHFGLILVE